MINNTENESILNTTVGKAIVGAIRNPLDKKMCANCSQCGAKGDAKFYCGALRKPVSSSGGCDRFKVKE